MKKINLIAVLLILLVFGITGLAEASIISFADSLIGIDNTSGWSNNNWVVQLSESYDLLGGAAIVTGYANDSQQDLSHRLTRGIGVWGAENDEVDSQTTNRVEKIEITFNLLDYWVNSLEVRSLFYTDTGWYPTNLELGAIDFYRDGTLLHTEYLFGNNPLTTTVGDLKFTYPTPYLVDALVFYVPLTVPGSYPGYQTLDDCQKATIIAESEFAVAKLNVTPIPEPATMLLFGSGLLGLAALGKKKKRS